MADEHKSEPAPHVAAPVPHAPTDPNHIGSDGEPTPVGNDAQRKSAEAFAKTVPVSHKK